MNENTNGTGVRPTGSTDVRPNVSTKSGGINRAIIGLLPFSPVEFTGPDKHLAWIRLAGYSLLAYYTFNKMRPVSYIAMSCAGLSLATSLSSSLFRKKSGVSE